MRKYFSIVLMQLLTKISLKYCFSERKIDPLIFVKMFEENMGEKKKPENNRNIQVNDIFAPVWAICNFK